MSTDHNALPKIRFSTHRIHVLIAERETGNVQRDYAEKLSYLENRKVTVSEIIRDAVARGLDELHHLRTVGLTAI